MLLRAVEESAVNTADAAVWNLIPRYFTVQTARVSAAAGVHTVPVCLGLNQPTTMILLMPNKSTVQHCRFSLSAGLLSVVAPPS